MPKPSTSLLLASLLAVLAGCVGPASQAPEDAGVGEASTETMPRQAGDPAASSTSDDPSSATFSGHLALPDVGLAAVDHDCPFIGGVLQLVLGSTETHPLGQDYGGWDFSFDVAGLVARFDDAGPAARFGIVPHNATSVTVCNESAVDAFYTLTLATPDPARPLVHRQSRLFQGASAPAGPATGADVVEESFVAPPGTSSLVVRLDLEDTGAGEARVQVLDSSGNVVFEGTSLGAGTGGLWALAGIPSDGGEVKASPGDHTVRYRVTGAAEVALSIWAELAAS